MFGIDLETAGLVAEGVVIAFVVWVARRHYLAYLRMADRWRASLAERDDARRALRTIDAMREIRRDTITRMRKAAR